MFSLKYRLVIVIAHLAAAGFINPPSMSGETAGDYSADAVYTLGSSLNITWYTSCPTVGLGLWQDGVNHVQSFTSTQPNTGFYNWDPINITFNLDKGRAFFFELYNNTPNTNSILFGSHYFNLTDGSSASSKTSSTTTTSTTTSSTSSTTSTTTSSAAVVVSTVVATVTPSSTAKSSGSTGLTPGAKTGLGVGLGVGVPVLAAIAVGLFLLGRKNRKTNPNTPAYGGQGDYYQQKPPLGSQYPAPIHELPQNTQRESQPLPQPTHELSDHVQ